MREEGGWGCGKVTQVRVGLWEGDQVRVGLWEGDSGGGEGDSGEGVWW